MGDDDVILLIYKCDKLFMKNMSLHGGNFLSCVSLSSSFDNQIDSIANAIEERAMWQKYGL